MVPWYVESEAKKARGRCYCAERPASTCDHRKTGLEVTRDEAKERVKQLIDATANNKADAEQASYIFGFKCYLPTTSS